MTTPAKGTEKKASDVAAQLDSHETETELASQVKSKEGGQNDDDEEAVEEEEAAETAGDVVEVVRNGDENDYVGGTDDGISKESGKTEDEAGPAEKE